jgi:hypothetical protein
MGRPRPTWTTAIAVIAIVSAAACGGGDDRATDDPGVDDAATGAPPTAPSVDDAADDADSDASGAAAARSEPATGGTTVVPIARYAAHGPQAANTIGPPCGQGNLPNGGDVFRFTPPEGWSWTATSSGSGSDEVDILDPDGVRFTVHEAKSAEERDFLSGWEVLGPAGVDLDLGGASFPMTEVTVAGGIGYAIVDLPYLGPLPLLPTGDQLGTVVVTSETEGRPTPDEAVAILASVRVERCAVISEAIVWAAAGGFAPVPRFEPDPLGKTWPDQPQPAIVGLPTLGAYTIEQLAYLMPVDEASAVCAAEAALAAHADDPMGYLRALVPSGTQQEELADVIAGC